MWLQNGQVFFLQNHFHIFLFNCDKLIKKNKILKIKCLENYQNYYKDDPYKFYCLCLLFTFVLPQLWGNVAVSGIIRDSDGEDVTDIWGRLGWQSQLNGVPCDPERLLRYLVLIVDNSWLQLCIDKESKSEPDTVIFMILRCLLEKKYSPDMSTLNVWILYPNIFPTWTSFCTDRDIFYWLPLWCL